MCVYMNLFIFNGNLMRILIMKLFNFENLSHITVSKDDVMRLTN